MRPNRWLVAFSLIFGLTAVVGAQEDDGDDSPVVDGSEAKGGGGYPAGEGRIGPPSTGGYPAGEGKIGPPSLGGYPAGQGPIDGPSDDDTSENEGDEE